MKSRSVENHFYIGFMIRIFGLWYRTIFTAGKLTEVSIKWTFHCKYTHSENIPNRSKYEFFTIELRLISSTTPLIMYISNQVMFVYSQITRITKCLLKKNTLLASMQEHLLYLFRDGSTITCVIFIRRWVRKRNFTQILRYDWRQELNHTLSFQKWNPHLPCFPHLRKINWKISFLQRKQFSTIISTHNARPQHPTLRNSSETKSFYEKIIALADQMSSTAWRKL